MATLPRTILVCATLTSGVALPATRARADTVSDAANDMASFVRSVVKWRRVDPGAEPERDKPEDCAAAVKRWRGRGVKDDDVLVSPSFEGHPRARVVQVGTVERPGMAFADMPALCAEFEQGYKDRALSAELAEFANALSWLGLVKGEETSLTQINQVADRRNGEACAAALAKAKAELPDVKVRDKDQLLTLAEFETRICKPLSTEVPDWVAAGRKVHRARREKAMAPYAAAGIGGKKLDLMIDYEGVYWRLAGGEKTDNPKKLAAASVLFHWLEGPARLGIVSHTVRRYQFKGNDLVKTTEKTYTTVQGATLPSSAFK
jgi:hypothetical protein